MLAALALLVAGSAAPANAPDPLHVRVQAVRARAAGVRPHSPEAASIASELGLIGRAYLEKGDSGRALELLDEAYGYNEDDGLVLALLTLAYVRREDYPFARFYLDLAEQRAPRAPPQAYEILGDVYYSLNRLEDAVAAWEHFQRLGGDSPKTLKALSKVRQELALTSGQRHLQTDRFSLFWDPAIRASSIETIAERLATTYATQSEFFATDLPMSQIVILYSGRTYFSFVSVPDWVSGLFDGKIRVSLDPEGGLTPELSGVLAHELAHAFVRQASADRAPGWLHEGLAQWLEGKRLTRSEIREEFRGRPVLSLSELEGNLAGRADRTAARTNYIQALGVVEYLFEKHGSGSVACLLRSLGEGRSLRDAMRAEIGLTPEELVRKWKEWARV